MKQAFRIALLSVIGYAIGWSIAAFCDTGTHAEPLAAPIDASARLKSLDAECVELLGPSPTDRKPGDAVRRLVEVEKVNFRIIQELWIVNKMTSTKGLQ